MRFTSDWKTATVAAPKIAAMESTVRIGVTGSSAKTKCPPKTVNM